MKPKNLVLTLFLFVLPVLAISALLWSIAHYKDKRTEMDHLPRIGQGAGDTGGANYIGEKLAGRYSSRAGSQHDEGDSLRSEEAGHASARPEAGEESSALVFPETLEQGIVIVVRDLSGAASDERPMYLASNHVGWNPGAAAMKMHQRSDTRWQIVLPQASESSRLEFKFTLGTWDTVELSATGEDHVPNRQLPKVDPALFTGDARPVFEFEVPSFKKVRDLETARRLDPYRTLDVTGDVRRVQVSGGAGPASGMTRDLLVWLPPGYDAPENQRRQYPVLFLHDGQNLFEHLPGVAGEWGADETAHRLISEGQIEPLIIVGVPHSGASRIEEYVPLETFRDHPVYGREYAAWFVREVVPRVRKTLRVRTDASGTAIGGSSLGAVISLFIAAENPDMFGGVLLESPSSLRLDDGSSPWREYAASIRNWPGRVYVGMGDREAGDRPADAPLNERSVRWAEELIDYARAGGAVDRRLHIGSGHRHTESAWAERLPAALMFLFPPVPQGVEGDQGPQLPTGP
ncbi:MAG: hypothetical protein KF866_01145 [Phycisphaeraceae bacterium]|nr:hypothetical protein [Phycisphaeraceae bacterium]